MIDELLAKGDAAATANVITCMAQGLNHGLLSTDAADEDDAKAARALYIDIISNMAESANDASSRSRMVGPLEITTAAPEQMTDNATDKALDLVGSLLGASDTISEEDGAKVAKTTSNLLKSSASLAPPLAGQRQQNNSDASDPSTNQSTAQSADRSSKVVGLIGNLTGALLGGSVAGESVTVSAGTFKLEGSRQSAADMGNKTAGGGAVMVPGGIDYGDSEEIDLHLVEWGEDNPFFEVRDDLLRAL